MINTEAVFTTAIEEMIENAEQMISEEFETDAMIEHETTTLTIGSEFLGKPPAYVNTVTMHRIVTGGSVPVERRMYSYMQDYWPDRSVNGTPKYWCSWDEVKFLILPTPDTADVIELQYSQRITGLFDLADAGETWLSINKPDLLFYACLVQAAIFEKNKVWQDVYQPMYDRRLAAAMIETEKSRRDADDMKG